MSIFVTLRETLWNRLLHVCNSERIPVYLSGIPYHPGNMFSWNHFTACATCKPLSNRGLGIFRVNVFTTLKMHTSLNIKLLRVAPRALFTSYTQNHKHGHVTLHSFLNLLSRPKIRRLRLPLNHIHTGHHKLCRPLYIW